MTFVWTPFTLTLSVIVLIAAAFCCLISWRRSGYSRSMFWLESLRFLLIALVVLTLNQPEFVQVIKPQEQPTLVILHDTSGSMKTQDVVNPLAPAEKPRTREESVAPVILPELWKPVEGRMKVVFEPFSSQPPTLYHNVSLFSFECCVALVCKQFVMQIFASQNMWAACLLQRVQRTQSRHAVST